MATASIERKIRVHIVGGNEFFTEVIAASLSSRKEITLFGWSSGFIRAFKKMEYLPIDIVLVDAGMEKNYAIQVIRTIKEELPNVKVVALGLSSKEEENLEFIEAGASDCILKNASIDEMVYTIETVYNEETDCSPRMAALVFARIAELSRQRSRESSHQLALTRREKEILQLIVKGFSNKDLSRHLRITPYTVKNHVHNLLDKLQVHRRRDAIRCAYRNGILKERQL